MLAVPLPSIVRYKMVGYSMGEADFTFLVIDCRKLVRMGMDGPALKVVMRGRSPVLFPLRRLRRIHILGTPSNGMEALLYCAEQQIPVAFFSSTGHLRCRLSPAAELPALVDHWFECVEFDVEVGQLYRDWAENQERFAWSRLGVSSGTNISRRKLAVEALQGYCRARLGRIKFQEFMQWMDGLLGFHVGQIIESCGFKQERNRARLREDMKRILEPCLLHALAKRLQHKSVLNVSAQSVTAFYQLCSEDIEYAGRRMLTQLVTSIEAMV